jgi:hypothetical protein
MTPLAFPDHNQDPRLKLLKPFHLQFAKAAWQSWQIGMPVGSIFMAKTAEYEEELAYSMGRQSIDKHKKELLPEDENDESFTKISWEGRQDGVVLLNIAKSKLKKALYNILCTPINPTAKDAQDAEYRKQKVKIMMRQAAQQSAPELSDHPLLKKMPGEADDLEELQMEIDFNPKFVRAKDTEEAIQLVFYENEMDKILDQVADDLINHGAAIVENNLDENNKVVLERVPLNQFACSKTNQPDFSDITWYFRVRSTTLSDLSKYFEPDEITKLLHQVQGTNGNPTNLGVNTYENNGYDIFKADVMHLRFISWDKRVTETNKDKNGNLRVSKAKPSTPDKIKGDTQFVGKTIQNIYECKWVVGTDLIYNFGKMPNMPRSVNVATMGKTKLPVSVIASNFANMRCSGLVGAMKSIIDDINTSTFKGRMFKNRMVPKGFDIDLNALENVAMGKGGKVLTPKEVVDMFFETGVLVSRRSGTGFDSQANYRAIQEISNSMADDLVALANDIQASKQALRDISGLNELTDGSTPNPKTLTTIANLANESTNNALYPYINARRNLIESVAKATVQRLQVAKKRGNYDGYNKAAGRWITVPDSINDFDYDIMIEDRPSDEQKQIIYQLMTDDIKNGYISHADVVQIIYSNNLKDAAILLSYKVEKGKQQQQQQALQNTQATAQSQIQSNIAAEQLKDQMADKQAKRQMEIDDNMQAWNYMIAKLKVSQADAAVDKQAITDILTSGVPIPQVPQQNEATQQPEVQQPAQLPQ